MKKIFILVFTFMILAFGINIISAGAKEPDKSTCEVYFGSDKALYGGYHIDGEDYYVIRDSILQLSHAPKAINVLWNEDEKCIESYNDDSIRDIPYENIHIAKPTILIYEMNKKNQWGFEEKLWAIHDLETDEKRACVAKDPFVYERDRIFTPYKETIKMKTVDGEYKTITRYAIYDKYYYNIKDIARLANYMINYSESRNAYFITLPLGDYFHLEEGAGDTRITYTPNYYFSLVGNASPIDKYIFDNGDDTFSTFSNGSPSLGESYKDLSIRTFKKNNFSCIGQKLIPLELDYYCGFFNGEKYNYIGYGAINPQEIPDKEIIRIVKYDKNFERISSLSLTTEQCYSISIANAGTMRMDENGNELAVHTSRCCRQTDDGLNHQSQLSLIIDTDTMTVKNYTGEFQPNHVSHSFNQFVKYDGDEIIYVDHGDAYPRAIALNFSSGKNVNLYNYPGKIGQNYTGVFVGGFEVSSENYLVTFNTVDFSGVVGTDLSSVSNERNACLAVYNKSADNTNIISLTDLFGKDMVASAPYLVKVNDNRFILAWNEANGPNSKKYEFVESKYVEVDSYGNFLTPVKSSSKCLPIFIQPMYMDNALYWFNDIMNYKVFYKLDLDDAKENPITVIYNSEKIDFDQNPIIENGRTLVPLRAIFEKIGADVQWDGTTGTVTATKGSTTVKLSIGNTTAYKNSDSITIDVPAKVLNDRTLVPVRFIADCFDVSVDWDGALQKVILTSK